MRITASTRVGRLACAAMLALAIGAGRSRAERIAADSQETRLALVRLTRSGVPELPLRHALAALACARARGEIEASTLTLIDYSRPSSARRLWVIDLAEADVLFHEHVSHGRNSGQVRATRFSNELGSHQSSLGLFRTAETYHGRHGYSLRLDGLEHGINDRARERSIVMHGADYVTKEVARRFGRVGRSWGCPAVDPAVNRSLIDTIRGGNAVFAWYPDREWLAQSPYQVCAPAAPAEQRIVESVRGATGSSAVGAPPPAALDAAAGSESAGR